MEISRKIRNLILPALFAAFMSFSVEVVLAGLKSAPARQVSVFRVHLPEEGPVLFFGHNDGRVPVVTFPVLNLFEENSVDGVPDTAGPAPIACQGSSGRTGGSGADILLHICKLQI